MKRRASRAFLLSIFVAAGLTTGCAGPGAQAPPGPAPAELSRAWDAEHVSPPVPALLDHAELEQRLRRLAASGSELFRLEEIGRSVEGRSINYVRVGHGGFHVLLWSQMHGDEPTATAALFDVFEYLRRHHGEEVPRRLLAALTLHVVPMLNPDGAERFQRRNAQGIDINRDALRLQTPEGRTLKALRDRVGANIGFNLHNQNWRTSVGDPPRPASVSLLSVAFDEARTENEGRVLTKKVCGVIRDALEPFAAGQIGRYSDEFEVRAFGDNITKWGTPVVLIETGPWAGDRPDASLVRLNFVALVSALDALATGRVHDADPSRYESLPTNESRAFYMLIRQGTIATGTGILPFIADLGIVANRRVRGAGSKRQLEIGLQIEDIGDLRVNSGLQTIDASGMTVAPLADARVTAGDLVKLPAGGSDDTRKPVIGIGAPAALMLLRPTGGERYRVERIIQAAEIIERH